MEVVVSEYWAWLSWSQLRPRDGVRLPWLPVAMRWLMRRLPPMAVLLELPSSVDG